jgi:hypothetical protein
MLYPLFRFKRTFTSSFPMGKANEFGEIPKNPKLYSVRYHLVLGPFVLGMRQLGGFAVHKNMQNANHSWHN